MSELTVEFKVHFERMRHGKKRLMRGEALPEPNEDIEPGSVPRLSRLRSTGHHSLTARYMATVRAMQGQTEFREQQACET